MKSYFKLIFLIFIVVFVNESYARDKWIVSSPNNHTIEGMGVELDPHFFTQNVTRATGPDSTDWYKVVIPRIKKLMPNRMRVMVLPQWYEPKNDNDNPQIINHSAFTFESKAMKSLYHTLDIAQNLNIDVTLVLWGAPINHFLGKGHSGNWVVAPNNDDEWCESVVVLLSELYKRGYNCIKEFTPVNEPCISYLFDGKSGDIKAYVTMCRKLDVKLREYDLRDKISLNLSDNIGSHRYWLKYCASKLSQVADILNSHTYGFGYDSPNRAINDWERKNVAVADSIGVKHYIGEFGTNKGTNSSPVNDVNEYERGVLLGRIAINCINAGAVGLSYWILFDQYYNQMPYKYMQKLGLWKSKMSEYAEDSRYNNMTTDFEPRPQYYAYGILTRTIRKGDICYPIITDNEFCAASALRSTTGEWKYLIANQTNTTKEVTIINPYIDRSRQYGIIVYSNKSLPSDDSLIKVSEKCAGGRNLKIKIKANSLTAIVPLNYTILR